jgi:hypothetical protein
MPAPTDGSSTGVSPDACAMRAAAGGVTASDVVLAHAEPPPPVVLAHAEPPPPEGVEFLAS